MATQTAVCVCVPYRATLVSNRAAAVAVAAVALAHATWRATTAVVVVLQVTRGDGNFISVYKPDINPHKRKPTRSATAESPATYQHPRLLLGQPTQVLGPWAQGTRSGTRKQQAKMVCTHCSSITHSTLSLEPLIYPKKRSAALRRREHVS